MGNVVCVFYRKMLSKPIECSLCQINIPNSGSAKLHLKCSQHKARAERYVDNRKKNES